MILNKLPKTFPAKFRGASTDKTGAMRCPHLRNGNGSRFDPVIEALKHKKK